MTGAEGALGSTTLTQHTKPVGCDSWRYHQSTLPSEGANNPCERGAAPCFAARSGWPFCAPLRAPVAVPGAASAATSATTGASGLQASAGASLHRSACARGRPLAQARRPRRLHTVAASTRACSSPLCCSLTIPPIVVRLARSGRGHDEGPMEPHHWPVCEVCPSRTTSEVHLQAPRTCECRRALHDLFRSAPCVAG